MNRLPINSTDDARADFLAGMEQQARAFEKLAASLERKGWFALASAYESSAAALRQTAITERAGLYGYHTDQR